MKRKFLPILCSAILVLVFIACSNEPSGGGGKTRITKPSLVQNNFPHTGSPQTVALSAENAAYTLGGNVSETNAGEYTATVTLTDTSTYEWEDGTTEVVELPWSINKATPEATTWPTASTITYGEALSTSTLTDGAGDGAFAWTNGTVIPTVTNSGYDVTFTPTDTANYSNVTQNVAITVNKAIPDVNWPANLTANFGQTLAHVALPNNGSGTAGSFSWVQPETTSVGEAGNREHELRFTPTDTANYNILTETVTITVRAIQELILTMDNFDIIDEGEAHYSGGPVVIQGTTGIDIKLEGTLNGTWAIDGSTIASDVNGITLYRSQFATDDNRIYILTVMFDYQGKAWMGSIALDVK